MGAEAFVTLQILDFAEGVDDRVAALLQAGTGITLTYNDGAGTLTIASTVSPTWGSIGGTLSNQTDLQTALNAKMGGSTGATDNRILRSDGTGGSTVQNSAVTIDDSGNISGVARLDSTRAGSMGSTNPQNQIVIYGGFAGYGIGFDANGELTTCVNSARRSTLGTHINLGSSGQLRFNSAADLSGSWDTLVVRNSTGPTVETRAAGGLRVRNADGSAVGALDCGAITASGTIAQSGTGVVATFGTDPTVVRIGNEGNAATFVNAYVGGYAAAAGASTIYFGQNLYWSGSAWLRPHSSGQCSLFWQQGGAFYFNTGAGFGTTRLTIANNGNLTSFALFFTGVYTVATLPSAAANAGALAQVTDSSVTTNGSPVAGGGSSRVVVFCNGSTWDVVVA